MSEAEHTMGPCIRTRAGTMVGTGTMVAAGTMETGIKNGAWRRREGGTPDRRRERRGNARDGNKKSREDAKAV